MLARSTGTRSRRSGFTARLRHRLTRLILAAGAVVLSISTVAQPCHAESRRAPKILLILADDKYVLDPSPPAKMPRFMVFFCIIHANVVLRRIPSYSVRFRAVNYTWLHSASSKGHASAFESKWPDSQLYLSSISQGRRRSLLTSRSLVRVSHGNFVLRHLASVTGRLTA